MADQGKDFLQKLRATFRGEAEEHLQEIISNIVLLEQAGEDSQQDFVERILRKLHTLKGAARAVNLSDLEALCHALESVLSSRLHAARALTSEQFDLLHQAVSLAQSLLQEPSGRVRNQAAALTRRLERLSTDMPVGENNRTDAAAGVQSAAQSAEYESLPPQSDAAETGIGAGDAIESANRVNSANSDVVRVQGKHLDAIRHQAEALLSVELSLQHHIADLLALADEIADEVAGRRDRMQTEHARPRRTAPPPHAGMSAPASRAGTHSLQPGMTDPTADINSDNSRLELRCRRVASALSRTQGNFALARSQLVNATLETALAPFSSALEQLPGLVRNLARSRGKEVVLSIEGESIQIDRRVLSTVREALIHLATNAVDHGIEPIEKRVANGKKAAGTLLVKAAYRSGNQVSLTVSDDGAGIDVVRLASAAVKVRGANADEIAALNEHQKLQLALQAGVSTIQELTSVSGRGVGLAIVAEKVAAIGGEMSIENLAGAGCSFQLVLPVRLATMRGVVLQTGGTSYVFPLSGLESVRALKDGDIQTVENRETLLAGGRVIPVIRLAQLLGLDRSRSPAANHEHIAVIARTGGNTFALLADEIRPEQEVLPKSLGKQLRRIRFITGATQLGDGSLVLILGLEDIARYGLAAGAAGQAAGMGLNAGLNAALNAAAAAEKKRVLVAEDSITSRLLLKHILESAGYQVDTAVDGLDALSKLRHENFDALVSDVEMPRLDGLALTQQVRANPKTAEMPVVLVTTLQSPDEKERGLQAGADAYVVKGSFDQDNLLATMRRLI